MPPTIRRGRPDDVRPVAELIAAAFDPLRASSYLVSNPGRRPKVLADIFEILVEHAILKEGLVDVIDGSQGPIAAAVWFDLIDGPIPPPQDYDERLNKAAGEYAHHFRVLDDLFAAHHPAAPHHHLALLAVSPIRQRGGLGSGLLRHHHHTNDGGPSGLDEPAAYLEASSPRSRTLYERHGYQVKDVFSLPDGTKFWTMLRPTNSTNYAVNKTL